MRTAKLKWINLAISNLGFLILQVSGDPDSWTPAKLDEAQKEIEAALKSLAVTDALKIEEDRDGEAIYGYGYRGC